MQVPPGEKPERPKILGPKPTIASKPKHLPPVRKISRDDAQKSGPKQTEQPHNEPPKALKIQYHHHQHPVESKHEKGETFQSYIVPGNGTENDKFRPSEPNQKAPTSPSTVCCSILSSATTDCCGIIPTAYKKEMNNCKSMSKMESVDSNSSDSGGFKDFLQLDQTVHQRKDFQTHQRNVSHPEFQDKTEIPPLPQQPKTHQRFGSQPDYMHNKPQYVPNAQALAPYLPLAEQKLLYQQSKMSDDSSSAIRQHITKFNNTSLLANEKTDSKSKLPFSNTAGSGATSNFQQSTKKLEELLSQRLEREKFARKGPNCVVDGESSGLDVEQKMNVQKQIQQKLHADLQQTVKQIQEIQSIELRLPQNRKWNEVSLLYFGATTRRNCVLFLFYCLYPCLSKYMTFSLQFFFL